MGGNIEKIKQTEKVKTESFSPDYQTFDVIDSISRFYMYVHIDYQLFSLNYSLGDDCKELARVSDVVYLYEQNTQFYDEIRFFVDQFFSSLRTYLLWAVSSELSDQTYSEFNLDDMKNCELYSDNSGHSNEESIRLFFARAVNRFSEDGWRLMAYGYGGEKWTVIADLGRQMWQSNISFREKIRLIDLFIDINHNSGYIFDKISPFNWGYSYQHDAKLEKFLENKKMASNGDELVKAGAGVISNKIDLFRFAMKMRRLERMGDVREKGVA